MNWQQEITRTVQTAQDLLPYITLTPQQQHRMDDILQQYPMSVPPYYLSLIDFDNVPNDPIFKMSIPSLSEIELDGLADTSGEAQNTVIQGMQHKYDETVMVLSTNQCAMYCRHCFRKRLVGLSDDEVASHFTEMRNYVLQHTEISNILVSGGDALLNSNRRLREILALFTDIPHIDTIRIATRVPVVLPMRITGDEELLDILKEAGRKKQLHMVSQFNHPNEITPQAQAAIQAIRGLGIPFKNQTVLLRGVNEDPAVLARLFRGLVANGVTPYYVFQCRPVIGVKNQFQIPLLRGAQIVEDARSMQNGFGKTFRYCMSHITGKLEILGRTGPDEILFKYHEAQDKANSGRIFTKKITSTQAWLPDELDLPPM